MNSTQSSLSKWFQIDQKYILCVLLRQIYHNNSIFIAKTHFWLIWLQVYNVLSFMKFVKLNFGYLKKWISRFCTMKIVILKSLLLKNYQCIPRVPPSLSKFIFIFDNMCFMNFTQPSLTEWKCFHRWLLRFKRYTQPSLSKYI